MSPVDDTHGPQSPAECGLVPGWPTTSELIARILQGPLRTRREGSAADDDFAPANTTEPTALAGNLAVRGDQVHATG